MVNPKARTVPTLAGISSILIRVYSFYLTDYVIDFYYDYRTNIKSNALHLLR